MISAEDGNLFLLWDDFIGDYNDFTKALNEVSNRYSVVIKENKRPSRDNLLQDLFKNNNYISSIFIHEIEENLEQIIGGALSASFSPKPGENGFDEFIEELKKVFNKYQKDGKVVVAFCSKCFLGKL